MPTARTSRKYAISTRSESEINHPPNDPGIDGIVCLRGGYGSQRLLRHLDPARIALETQSRHTLENLRNHRAMYGTAGAEALVTSRCHLHRALLMAEGLGLSPMPVAAEDRPAVEPVRLLGEGFRVHWYVTGRMLARLLRRRAWLARIG